jgi:multiple sugar transport system permease protein
MRLASKTAQYVVMSLFAVAFLAPLVWMISASLRPEAKVLSVPPQFLPGDAQWDNYRQIFELIPVFLWNSVKLAGLNVVGILIVASMAGYAFARLRFACRDFAFMVLLATSIIPGIAYLIPQYIVFRHIGWVDTQYPLWVPKVLTPVFATFLMRQSFLTIPQELEDAGKIDGASTFGIYWRIMLPQTSRRSPRSGCSPSSSRGTTCSVR